MGKVLKILCALALAAVPLAAYADEGASNMSTAVAGEAKPYVILDGSTEIEKLTDALSTSQADLAHAEAQIAELQKQVDDIEAKLPAQQQRSDEAMKQRYIMQSNPLVVVDSLISSPTMGDFLRQVDYLEIISRTNLAELNRSVDMKRDLDAAKEKQAVLRDQAESATEKAQAELRNAQEKRAKAQAEGIAEARSQAGAQGGEKSVGVAYDGGKQDENFKEAASEDVQALDDKADWYASRDEFVETWTERIDAYLKGSALEGQGVHFAEAAWKHNVDPRWSPAISNTESSKGAICIRPYNAWGWGAADSDPYGLALEWGSWEEAIDAHVAGLAKGYGYTISMDNAKKYCPITWQSWYNKTLDQMSRI